MLSPLWEGSWRCRSAYSWKARIPLSVEKWVGMGYVSTCSTHRHHRPWGLPRHLRRCSALPDPAGSSSQRCSLCLGDFPHQCPAGHAPLRASWGCLCSALPRAALGLAELPWAPFGVCRAGFLSLPPLPSQLHLRPWSKGKMGAVTSALSLAGSKGQRHRQCLEVQGTHVFPWTWHPGPGRAQKKRLPASSTLTERLVPPPLFCRTLS